MKSQRPYRPLGWGLTLFILLTGLIYYGRTSPQAAQDPGPMRPPSSQELPARPDVLERLAPQIEELRRIFNAPSFAVGVLHNGDRSFKGFGRISNNGGSPDENTVYGVGSCTKGFTSTVLSRLAHDGILRLDHTPISSKLPDLKTSNSPDVSRRMTVRDMVSHCAGLNQLVYSVVGKEGDVFANRSDVVGIFNHLPKVAGFRSEWQYNNWLFALAGVVVTRLSGKTFGTAVKDEVFTKLGMDRSYFTCPPDDNVAFPIKVFDNHPPEQRPLPDFGDGDAFDSSGSLRSCVKDMLSWADALMEAWKDMNVGVSLFRRLLVTLRLQANNPPRTVPEDLHKALQEIQKPYFPLGDDDKQMYAMGLYSYHLPTTAINTVTNFDVNNVSYVLGGESRSRPVVGHTGEYGGFLSAYWTFPEDDLAIVVLCNAFEINGDPTNIVAQLIAQDVMDLKPRVDFEHVSRSIVENARNRWTTLRSEWTSHRDEGTHPREINLYEGTYRNAGLAMELSFEVVKDQDTPFLRMNINGLPGQVFDLYHYDHDNWTFLPETRDACIAQGYSAYISRWDCSVIEFGTAEDGRFQEVRWRLDDDERVDQTIFLRES